MTVAQTEPLSDEGGIDHTPKTSHPRAFGGDRAKSVLTLQSVPTEPPTPATNFQKNVPSTAPTATNHAPNDDSNATMPQPTKLQPVQSPSPPASEFEPTPH